MRSFRLLLFFVLLPAFGFAQGGGPAGGLSGGAELAVTIRTPDGRSVRSGVRVQLLNYTGVPVDETTIRGEGLASFLNVSGGQYRVRVSGNGYQTAVSDSVEVSRNQRHQSIYMTVNEVTTVPAVPAAPGSGMVDTRTFQVPAKAKKELDKGMDAFRQGDFKGALSHLDRAIALYPDYVEAYNDLGVVRINQDDTAGAKQAFEKAVQMNDHFAPAYANLARMALERRDLPGASAMVDRAASSDPMFVDGLALQARVRYLEGRYDAALALVGRVHGQPHDRFAEVHLIAAEIYGMAHQNKDAIAECETYLKEDPQSRIAARVRQTMAILQARKD